MNKILITGIAGFIGYQLGKRLLEEKWQVVGIDNMNAYYDVQLKIDRLKQLEGKENFQFYQMDISDKTGMAKVFSQEGFDSVVNLAAQAGVRYSLTNPYAYIESNISGFTNILEGCRHHQVKHLVFASSSSVYGANTNMPFSVHQNVDHPMSLYAATKKANELMAHTYASLYGLPVTGLRFFTVYGPWGRPDMALFLFTKAILAGKPINVFNNGKMRRDFTYIDDIVEGVVRVIERIPESNPDWRGDRPDPATSYAPYNIFNIGNNNPIELLSFINIIEDALGKKAIKNMMPMQPGDVPATYADIDDLMQLVGFTPKVPIDIGIRRFIDWYTGYYKIEKNNL
jgi:UDP-glucuronate 4-epimerase